MMYELFIYVNHAQLAQLASGAPQRRLTVLIVPLGHIVALQDQEHVTIVMLVSGVLFQLVVALIALLVNGAPQRHLIVLTVPLGHIVALQDLENVTIVMLVSGVLFQLVVVLIALAVNGA